MQLTFFWRKQMVDTVAVTELPWMYVSITAPAKLAGASRDTIEQELRIVDESGRRYAIDVEPLEEDVAGRYHVINGYVRRTEEAPAMPVARPRAKDSARALHLPPQPPVEAPALLDAA